MWKFSSGVVGRLLPTPLEVFFLPPRRWHTPLVDKCPAILPEAAHVLGFDPGVLCSHPDDALVAILNGDKNEPLLFQCAQIGANLTLAHPEEIPEVFIGGVTTVFVVERMDFNEQDFFHNRQILREPNLFGNPDTFEITWGSLHFPIVSGKQPEHLITGTPLWIRKASAYQRAW